MSLIYEPADLFSTPYRFIGHGCNNHSVMGAGVALEIKKRFPHAYEVYAGADVQLGDNIFATCGDKTIINMITQKGYGRRKRFVSYDAVDLCFQTLRDSIVRNSFVAIPPIGSGLGGGDWEIISKIIERASEGYYQVVVYTKPGVINGGQEQENRTEQTVL